MTTPAGDDLIGSADIRVTMDTDAAQRAIRQFTTDANGRLRDLRGRFAADSGEINQSLTRIGTSAQSSSGAALGALGSIVPAMGAVSAAGVAAGAALAALPLAFAGLGAVALKENEQVKDAFSDTAETIKSTLADAAEPLIPVFVDVAERISTIMGDIAPQLGQAFEATAPLIEPFVTSLGKLVENMLPGIVAATEAAKEPLAALGAGLEQIGTGLSGFFEGLAVGAEGGGQAISALLGAVAAILPPLGELLGDLAQVGGPVLSALVSALVPFVTTLTGALQPVLVAVAPVLKSIAEAFGALVTAVSPLLPVIGNLVASLLPPLVPVIDTIAMAFTALAPIVAQIGQILTAVLTPVIAALPSVLAPLIAAFSAVGAVLFPLISQLLTALTPALTSLGQTFGQLLVALSPLLVVLGQALAQALIALTPLITRHIELFGQLASVFAGQLARVLNTIVVPAINLVSALIRGDFSAAWSSLRGLISGVAQYIQDQVSTMGRIIRGILDEIVSATRGLPGRLSAALATLGSVLASLASRAWGRFRTAVANDIATVVALVRSIPGRFRSDLSSLGGILSSLASAAWGRFRSAVSSGITSAVSLARSAPGKFRSALGNLDSLLASAGRSIIQGLINGMSGRLGELRRKAAEIADTVTSALDSVLDFGSPSKVMIRLGKFIGDGLVKGLAASEAKIKSSAKRLAELLRDAVSPKGITRRENRLLRLVADDSKQLRELARARSEISDRLKKANDKLNDVERKYAQVRSGIADQIKSAGSIVQGTGRTGPTTAENILAALQQSVTSAEQFQEALATLQEKGLRADLLQQIASAGVQAGSATAKALLAATPAQVDAINESQRQLSVAARETGITVADALYGAGVSAAQGLVDGLKSQKKSIQDEMDDIAEAMVKAIKKALKIKSPSQVMRGLGVLTGDGMAQGLHDSVSLVRAAASRLSDAATSARGVSGSFAPLLSAPGATTPRVARSMVSPVSVAAPSVTVMIGNRVINDHIQTVVDKQSDEQARQRVQGVRR